MKLRFSDSPHQGEPCREMSNKQKPCNRELGAGSLKQCGYATTIGHENHGDHLLEKKTGNKIPLAEYKGVFIVKTNAKARWGNFAHTPDFDQEYAWSMLMAEEDEAADKAWGEYCATMGTPHNQQPTGS